MECSLFFPALRAAGIVCVIRVCECVDTPVCVCVCVSVCVSGKGYSINNYVLTVLSSLLCINYYPTEYFYITSCTSKMSSSILSLSMSSFDLSASLLFLSLFLSPHYFCILPYSLSLTLSKRFICTHTHTHTHRHAHTQIFTCCSVNLSNLVCVGSPQMWEAGLMKRSFTMTT